MPFLLCGYRTGPFCNCHRRCRMGTACAAGYSRLLTVGPSMVSPQTNSSSYTEGERNQKLNILFLFFNSSPTLTTCISPCLMGSSPLISMRSPASRRASSAADPSAFVLRVQRCGSEDSRSTQVSIYLIEPYIIMMNMAYWRLSSVWCILDALLVL
jgi:hypothetical protein